MPIWLGIILIVLMCAFCYTTHIDLRRRELREMRDSLLDRKKELEDKLTKYSNDYSVKTFLEGEIAEINKDLAVVEKNYADNDFKMFKKDFKKFFEEK